MKKRKKALVGAVMLLNCGLYTAYGKYLYQESRTDVIHTAEFGNDSETAAEEETNMEPDENIFFSDGSTWESEELFSDFVCEEFNLYLTLTIHKI